MCTTAVPNWAAFHIYGLAQSAHLIPFHLQMNGLAAQGRYEGSGDGGAAAQSLYVANHAY